ncbi:PREDICTED: uncharacterized protein LOC104754072 [Camelina sativa]|uniref:Uncharacterized protein LOC104754072 n=1 Tax=Camelina sativa TaxID=90675 RepID=A0ABM1R316_CAMSA|nr:PREDICTED: uncharacterized protein LOC104754072 [Camelina sativa]
MSSTTVWSMRERSPSSYSLKIQNFSQLEKSTLSSDGKYQSRIFSSGGYDWKLILYPKGNDNDNESDFISMYLKLDSSSLSSKPSTEVFADFRFFVFNKKSNKYLYHSRYVYIYVESKPFNSLRSTWGLPQVLPLNIFKDPENGFVSTQDQCEFGVDVIVAPPPTNWEIISFNDKLPYPKFSWRVKNFSELKEHCHRSRKFTVEGREWILELYPNANLTRDRAKWISIFLTLEESEGLDQDEKIFKQANIRVLDPRGSNHLSCSCKRWHDKLSPSWGFAQFVSMDDLKKIYLDVEDLIGLVLIFLSLLALIFILLCPKLSSAGVSGISGFWLFLSDRFMFLLALASFEYMFLWPLTVLIFIANHSVYIIEYLVRYSKPHNDETSISTESRGIDDDTVDVRDASEELQKMRHILKELREDEKKMDTEMEFMEHIINSGLETHRKN